MLTGFKSPSYERSCHQDWDRPCKYSPWPFSDWPLLTALRSIQHSAGGGLAAGPRRAAVGHTRAPRLPFRRQPWVSLPGSSMVRLPQMGELLSGSAARLERGRGNMPELDSERFRSTPRTGPSWCGRFEGRLPAQQRMGRAMDERTSDQSRGSDTLAKVLYPTLFFLVLLLWVYVPA